MFDTTINMGNLIQIVVMIIGGIVFLLRMERKVIILTERLENIYRERDDQHKSNIVKFNEIEDQLKKLIDVIVELARLNERMAAIDGRVQELSNRLIESIKPVQVRKKG